MVGIVLSPSYGTFAHETFWEEGVLELFWPNSFAPGWGI